jgi:phosphatidylglycerophosphate synthase
MLDATIRRLIDPPLNAAAARIAPAGVSANALTIVGFLAGVCAIVGVSAGSYLIGLALILLNRILDGLDGAVARRSSPTDLGAYFDITLDFIVYAGVPFGFAIADPSRALAASFLILSFVSTGTTFLAYAIFAAKRGVSTELRGRKSLYYLGGLTEGTETFIAFALMCAFPQTFVLIAYVFGGLCFVTAAGRIAAAVEQFGTP